MKDRTKQDILDSFNELVQHHDFDSITVKMITDKAGVGRATFYRYFKDKYDVMNYNFTVIMEEYFNTKKCKTFEDLFCVFLDIGTEKWATLTRMFESSGANSLHQFIYDTCYTAAIFVLGSKKGLQNVTDEDKLRLSILCHGIPFAYEEWINGKYKITSREASRAVVQILPEELKGPIWQ